MLGLWIHVNGRRRMVITPMGMGRWNTDPTTNAEYGKGK